MPAKYTLSRAEFTQMRGFRRVHGTLFSLSYGTLDRIHPGAACVVSAKTAPQAVMRNTIKRRVRSFLTPLLARFKVPMVVVFHAKKPANEASQGEISEEIRVLLVKIGVLGP